MEIAPTENEAGVRKAIDDLVYRASLTRNRNYTLPGMKEADVLPSEEKTPAENAALFLKTYDSIAETDTEDLNSYEIFTGNVVRRFVNSEGVDVTETYPKSMTEVVVNARKEGHEIELYRLYHSGNCDSDGLKRDIEETLRFGKDRLRAVPTPQITDASVLFSTDAALPLYRYFLENTSARFICMKMNDWEIGKPVCTGIEGDTVTVKALRSLPNSSSNHAYDREGSPVRDLVILQDSVPQAYWGSRQFCCYLGLEDGFSITNWEAEPGSTPAEELRRGKTLEVVEFSDFQVDSVTGDIFGEIRLAYLREGDTVTPVTGGSVSGSMKELVKHMHLSQEMRQYDHARIPAVTRLDGVTVTGK